MHREDPHRRLGDAVGGLLEKRGVSDEECKALLELLPSKWERFSDVVLLPGSAFRGEWSEHTSDELWRVVSDALKVGRVGRMGEISGEMRESSVEMLLGDDDWVVRRESGIEYGYNLTQCMFSAGNVNERRRMGEVARAGEVVVDLYSGIGYYTLPMLVHSQVGHVHCCEWNPNAVRALDSNLESNGVAEKCTVHIGDNRITAANLTGVADLDGFGKLSTITKKFSVPLIFRLGIQKDIIGSEEDSANRLTISMDGINPIDYTVYGGVGIEYSWQNIAFIRGGTRLFHDTAGISLGGGLQWSMFIVDYAYVNYGILKEIHQFGISLNF